MVKIQITIFVTQNFPITTKLLIIGIGINIDYLTGTDKCK